MSSRVLIDSPVTPDALPAVHPGDLMRAWSAATVAAEMGLEADWTDAAGVTFRGPGGEMTVLFEDVDARVWVAGINRAVGLDTTHGIALCFRLLALIDLMASAPWTRPLFELGGPDGAEIHPALFRVASSMPLGRDARFDSREFERRTRPLTGPARLT